jgi:hypothetical protein
MWRESTLRRLPNDLSIDYRKTEELGQLSQYSVWLQTGQPGFDPWQRQRIFSLASVSRPALGPIQPPIQWIPGGPFSGGKAHAAETLLNANSCSANSSWRKASIIMFQINSPQYLNSRQSCIIQSTLLLPPQVWISFLLKTNLSVTH